MKWIEAVPVASKACGACTMCCKLFDIDWLDRPKPAGKWCHHCKPGQGCAIWQSVPKRCADYYCVWRLDPDLPDDWRPDRARFVLTHASEDSPLTVLVDPTFPDAWRKEPYYSRLRASARDLLIANGTTLVVATGAQRSLIFPDGEVPIPPGVALHEIVIEQRKGPAGPKFSARFPE